MQQPAGSKRFAQRLHAGLTGIAYVTPVVLVGMLVAWLYIAAQYGNSRPNNWLYLQLVADVIEISLLPLIGIWLLAMLTRELPIRGHRWPVLVPGLLVLLAAVQCGMVMKGLERVHRCETFVVMC